MYNPWKVSTSFPFAARKLWQIVYTKLNSSRPDDCLHIRSADSRALVTLGQPTVDSWRSTYVVGGSSGTDPFCR
jgi:hypothetical protein